jgi:hypothetical protein
VVLFKTFDSYVEQLHCGATMLRGHVHIILENRNSIRLSSKSKLMRTKTPWLAADGH